MQIELSIIMAAQAPPKYRHRAMSTNEHLSSKEHQEAFRLGVEHFNERRFFEAHETWEEIWLKSPEPEKTFLQGIIQIAAAFHHYSRGNTRGTCNLLEAGLRRLERFPAAHDQVELETLRVEARAWADGLRSGHDPGHAHLPKIAYAGNE